MALKRENAKFRIARFDYPNGKTEFQVQERGFFGWHGIDDDWECNTFDDFEDAKEFLNKVLPWGKPKMTVVKKI